MNFLPARLAAVIVARYPRAWRARYADEVLALVEDGGAGWRDVFDLARNAVTEWRLSLTSPDEHFRVSGFILRATPVVQALLLAMAAQVLAILVVPFIAGEVSIPQRWMLFAAFVIPFVLVRRILILGPFGFERIAAMAARQLPKFRPYTRRETSIWIVLLFMSTICVTWAQWPRQDPTVAFFTLFVFSLPLLANTGRGAEKRHAYGVIQHARDELRLTQWMIARLESVRRGLAHGSALERARADVITLTARIDEARHRLRELNDRHAPATVPGHQS
jgi:hypothetical protein